MIFFLVVNEVCRVFFEGIVVKVGDIDIVVILGMGFFVFRGGVVYWGDFVGFVVIVVKFCVWFIKYGGLY